MPTALTLVLLAYTIGVVAGGLWASTRLCLVLLVLAALSLGLSVRRAAPGLLLAALLIGASVHAPRPPPPVPDGAPLLIDGVVSAAPLAERGGVVLRISVDRALPVGRSGTRAAGGQILSRGRGPEAARPPEQPARAILFSPALRILVHVQGTPSEVLFPGDRVRLNGHLRPPQGFRNPGGIDAERRAAAEGIDAVLTVEPEALFRWGEEPRPGLLRAAARLRARLLGILGQHLQGEPLADPTAWAVVASLTLGERGALDRAEAYRSEHGLPGLERVFRGAGVYHVLSVSGLHLSVVCYLVYAGLSFLLVRLRPLAERVAVRRIAALSCLPVIACYVLLTDGRLATMRAAGMAVLMLGAQALMRNARPIDSLCAALLFMLCPLGAPLALFDPGLQLSAAAVLGMIRVGSAPAGPRGGQPRPDVVSRAARAALALLRVSLAAMLFTAPLCAFHFFEIELGGLVGNLLVLPLAEVLVIPLGMAGLAADLAWRGLGAFPLRLAGTAAETMVALAEVVAGWGLTLPVPQPGPAALLASGCALFCVGRRHTTACLCLALAVLLTVGAVSLSRARFRATFLDVGQGDAMVLEAPPGRVLVVDAGGLGERAPDPGERALLPFLRHRGHRRIDLLVLSHPHPDHAGGLLRLIEEIEVGELWLAPGAAALPPFDASVVRALHAARRRGVQVAAPRPTRLGAVEIEPLHPCLDADGACRLGVRGDLSHNDNSLVLRVRYAGRVLLLPGDLELPGELLLLERGDRGLDVRADVLKAPHHCSRTSSSAALLHEVRPQIAVCSLGRGNRFGFPHKEVLSRYAEAGIRLYRTDQQGAISLLIEPRGTLSVETMR